MDPTQDPNFLPPSSNPNIEPTAPASEIPKAKPIVLSDFLSTVPITHETKTSIPATKGNGTSSIQNLQQQIINTNTQNGGVVNKPISVKATSRPTKLFFEEDVDASDDDTINTNNNNHNHNHSNNNNSSNKPSRCSSPRASQTHKKHNKVPSARPTEFQPMSSGSEDGCDDENISIPNDHISSIERDINDMDINSNYNNILSNSNNTNGIDTNNLYSVHSGSSTSIAIGEESEVGDESYNLAKERRSDSFTNFSNIPRVHSFQIADLEEVPHGIQRQSKTLKDYKFPTHRLQTRLKNTNKFPLVIVACGSFSPITYLHLRMFEMALDSIREQTKFEVIGGYYSPVSDNYKKQGLAKSADRVRMCELACERTSSWLMVDAWESLQEKYTRTALVLDHFNHEINVKRGGVYVANPKSKEKMGVKIMLLAGGDLIESMGEPNVWADQDLHHILGNYGCLIVERTGSDVRSFLLSHDIMYEHRMNILVIKQLIYNDISSTKVRLFIRRGMSVQYLLPNSVIRYIQEHKLYINESEPVKQVLDSKE